MPIPQGGYARDGKLTTEQRQCLRSLLATSGLRRTGYTPDPGDGSYSEVWETPGVTVLIKWEPKAI